MKSILITLIASAVCTVAIAQQPDKALSRVSYSFTHMQDTTQKDKPYTENMLLVIGKNASVYTSYDKINQGINRRKQLEEQLKNQAGSNNMSINIDNRGIKPVSQLDYFYFVKENKLLIKERIFNNYLVDETSPKINWKISKDTASFSGIHCQKATAYFKGRNWIAWFAPELPFQSGPWKLNGLPGLILEAYDEKKEVAFQFDGIETVTATAEKPAEEAKIISSPGSFTISAIGPGGSAAAENYMGSEIKLPADAIPTSRKEIEKLKEARAKDPQGFMKAQMAGSTSTVVVTGYSMSPSGSPVKKVDPIVINNPIELPEKK